MVVRAGRDFAIPERLIDLDELKKVHERTTGSVDVCFLYARSAVLCALLYSNVCGTIPLQEKLTSFAWSFSQGGDGEADTTLYKLRFYTGSKQGARAQAHTTRGPRLSR